MRDKIESLFRKHNIKGVSCDSRNIRPDDAFFAIRGETIDGNQFIDEALQIAKIVFTEDASRKEEEVFYIQNIRLALAIAAGIIYPNLSANLVAITGTNGKTSVVSYIYQILKLLGQEAATIGTLGVNSTIELEEQFLKELPHSLTTADPITFRKILNELAEKKISNVIFEASSHGITQRRLGDIKAKTAGFTSFSQDHLDYHKTMDNYLEAKLQLFRDNLEEKGEVVINTEILDSTYGDFVKNFFTKHGIQYFGVGKSGNIKVKNISSSITGNIVDFEYNKRNYAFTTNIIGSFQAVNLLMAAKMTANLGVDFDRIVEVLEKVTAVTGRLQRITALESEVQVFVDYAHTPDALEKSLLELRNIKAQQGGMLYVVFGCGGDRDPSKRGLMGQVACKLADYVVVTDDNPRTENPEKIRLDVLKGAAGAEEVPGRELAIKRTIGKLKKNDILLIAGKGHETYQIIGNRTLFFSDIETAQKMLLLRNK